MATEGKNRAKEQAQAQLRSIIEMVKALETEDLHAREEAEQAIHDGPLEVSVRSDWHDPGGRKDEESEYKILLCTGGPAVRIIGDLDRFGQPETASLEYQDWFTPWESFDVCDDEEQALLAYAGCFYYR